MPRYVFYTKELDPIGKPEQIYGILRDTIPYWKYYYQEQSEYVINHSTFLETKIERDYARDRIIARIVGIMTEQDYIWYRLKFEV